MKLTNLKIEQLKETLKLSRHNQEVIRAGIQKEYDILFKNDKTLQEDIINTSNASMYTSTVPLIHSPQSYKLSCTNTLTHSMLTISLIIPHTYTP